MTELFDNQEPAAAKPKRTRAKAEAAPAAAPATETLAPEESVGALVTTTTANPVAVFTDEAKFSEFYQKLKAATDQHVPDLTTDKGRKAVASLAFKVTKAKTTLVAAGKGLTEDWRKQIALVNATRNKMEEELDALADEVRRPLTEWEQAEAVRKAANTATIAKMRADALITDEDTSATVEARGRAIYDLTFDEPQWTLEERESAVVEQMGAVRLLHAARGRLAAAEAAEAELQQLRAEKAERDAKDEAARIERERIEAEAEAARQEEARIAMEAADAEAAAKAAEEARVAAQAAEAARIEQAARDAAEAERVRLEAVREAEREAERQAAAAAEAEREAQRAAEKEEADRLLQIQRDRAAAAERAAEQAAAAAAAAEAERQRVASEAAAEAARLAEDQRKRTEDIEHRRAIKTAVKEAIMEASGVAEEAAVKIVVAIIAGDVPHTTVAF